MKLDEVLLAIGCVAMAAGCATIAVWLVRRLWTATEGDVDNPWAYGLPEVPHVGATEGPTAAGEIGTLAELPSDDLLTFAEQVAGADDEWYAFDQALVDYENAILGLRRWPLGGAVADTYESVQQRIDRWLHEGGVGVEHARSEVRQALSETWEDDTRELALVDRSDAEHVVVVLLAS